MPIRAKDLKRGDHVCMQAAATVVAVHPIAGGKRIKVTLQMEDTHSVEFTDYGAAIGLICRPGRQFQVYGRWHGDDGDYEPEPTPTPNPNKLERV
jgi:hypothetical protein